MLVDCVFLSVERRADTVRERSPDGHQAARAVSSLSGVRGTLWTCKKFSRIAYAIFLPSAR